MGCGKNEEGVRLGFGEVRGKGGGRVQKLSLKAHTRLSYIGLDKIV